MAATKFTVGPAAHCGNGLVTSVENGPQPVIHFLSECRECTEFLWFHLSAKGVKSRPLRFIWENAYYCLGNSSKLANVRPVYNIGGGWRRVDTVEIIETLEGPHVSFVIPPAKNTAAVAFCYPYGLAELESMIGDLPAKPEETIVAVSSRSRPIKRFRFPASTPALRGSTTKPPGVYIIARQHSGETPGTWAMDGIFRFLAAGGAPGIEWWLVPFVDLDGVEDGNYGKDALPFDFNRAWGKLPMRPELKGLQRDIATFSTVTSPSILLDLHAPGHNEDGVYTHLPHDGRPDEQRSHVQQWAECLHKQLVEVMGRDEEAYWHDMNYISRWDKNNTVCSWAWDEMKLPAFGTEVSYQSYGGEILDPDGYRKVGRSLALSAMDYLTAAKRVE
jgi:hypothetical protein